MSNLEPNSWVFTDPHFHHNWLVETGKRPVGFEQILMDSWLAQVQPDDWVFCLGDICMNDKVKVHKKYIAPMPGRKILIRGNHDLEKDIFYLQNGWSDVFDKIYMNAVLNGTDTRVLMTHIPVADNGKFDINVHGHFHNDGHRANTKEMRNIRSPKHRLLALECVGYKLIPFVPFLEGKIDQPGLFQIDAK
jgi:calcineurin-like phosphoesterase family protein